jgi:hypothetical protein
MHAEERRVLNLGGEFGFGKSSRVRIESRDVNAFALRAGVRADVNEVVFGSRRCRKSEAVMMTRIAVLNVWRNFMAKEKTSWL